MCELLGVSHTFLKEGKKTQKSQRICCLYSETRTAQSSQSGNLCAFLASEFGNFVTVSSVEDLNRMRAETMELKMLKVVYS